MLRLGRKQLWDLLWDEFDYGIEVGVHESNKRPYYLLYRQPYEPIGYLRSCDTDFLLKGKVTREVAQVGAAKRYEWDAIDLLNTYLYYGIEIFDDFE